MCYYKWQPKYLIQEYVSVSGRSSASGADVELLKDALRDHHIDPSKLDKDIRNFKADMRIKYLPEE